MRYGIRYNNQNYWKFWQCNALGHNNITTTRVFEERYLCEITDCWCWFDHLMEGFVYRKTGFGGFYARVFAVLEKQRLSFYETLDTKTHEYTGFKGTLYLKCGTLITLRDGARRYCLKILEDKVETRNNEKSEVIDCGDAKSCQAWATALNKAFKYHTDLEEKIVAPRRFRALLELPEEGELTKAQITKQYKRVCLKNHPDKGNRI